MLFVLAEDISVEDTDEGVEATKDDKVDPCGFVDTPFPHEEEPEKGPKLASIENVLYVSDCHDLRRQLTQNNSLLGRLKSIAC